MQNSLQNNFKKVYAFARRGLLWQLCFAVFLSGIFVVADTNHEFTTNSFKNSCAKNSCFLSEKEVLQSLFIENELQKLKFINSKTKLEIGKAIIKASDETGLPEKLIWALIRHESSFKPRAVSTVGAKGLTQLMPNTARAFCGLTADHVFVIEDNVMCGSRYLKKLVGDFDGDLKLALAAYNVGPSHIKKLIKNNQVHGFKQVKSLIPRSTRKYVSSIQASYLKTV